MFGGFQKGDLVGKRDGPGGRPEVEAGAPKPAASSPEVVSAAADEALASARQDAPQDWALLDRVLDGSPIGIVVLDRDLRILRVNTRAAQMFGVDERRHAGRRVKTVLPRMYAEISTILADIIAGGSPHIAVETSAPKLGARTPRRLYLAYYYPLAADAAIIGVGCMFIDVTDQRTAEGALLESEAKRRAILGEMLRAEESERSRLALELHDDTIQVLCALLLQLDGMIPLAENAGDEEIARRLATSRHVLSAATDRARRLMFELHPNLLPERGLRVAIAALAEEIGRDTGARWSVDVPAGRYPWTVEEFAYRVTREALTNVRKHSDAGAFSVTLFERGTILVGVVQDDGRGFAEAERAGRAPPHHLGIDGMRERARLAGGDVEITSPPGAGVRVEFSFPFRDPTQTEGTAPTDSAPA
jgi:PAS domain S-box-containing protein